MIRLYSLYLRKLNRQCCDLPPCSLKSDLASPLSSLL